jgi:hypothetical protein
MGNTVKRLEEFYDSYAVTKAWRFWKGKGIKLYTKSFQIALNGTKFRISPASFQVVYRGIVMICVVSNFTLLYVE